MPSPAQKETVGAYRNTDSLKAVNALIKVLNVSSFNYTAFAYHFVQKAPGPVIVHFFKAFEAVANVLSENIDRQSWEEPEEYTCGIIAKRMQDGLTRYE